MRLRGELLPISDLCEAERQRMLSLMVHHYEGVCPDRFAADLEDKQWVIALYDRADELQGFSTQAVFEVLVDGKRIRALFSGDTIVDREHWGDPALSHIWGRLALDLIDMSDETELYWFLISQGFRTYRFLPVFFREFYPRYDRPMPPRLQRILKALASERFDGDFDLENGIVRAGRDQYRLRDRLAAIPTKRLRDPHIEHFRRLNPHSGRGDELCCLAPLTRENFTSAAWRVIYAGNREACPCQLPLG